MNINTKAFIYLVGVSIVFSIFFLLQPQPDNGWSSIAQGIGIFFIVVITSVIFGVRGFFLSKEKKFLHALAWLIISFLFLFGSFQLIARYRQTEWRKTHPQNPTSQAVLR